MNARKAAIVSLLACCTLLTGQLGAAAAEIKVLSSAALRPVLDVVGPQFEQQSGHKLRVRYELTPAVKKLADEGEAFDLLIANPPHVDDLIAKNKAVAGSRIDIASFGVGVGVRSGSARSDVSSVEAFKRSLLGASSVAFVGAGTSGAFVTRMLEHLAIREQMAAKLKPGDIPTSLSAVASGEIQLVLMPVPLLRSAKGIELAGPLPAELQEHIIMSGVVSTRTSERDAAQALARWLMSSEIGATIKAKGFERVAP